MPVRLAKEEDLPQILAIYAPYITDSSITFEYEVPTLEDFTARFHAITRQFPWLVWEEDGKILGYAYGSLPFERAGYRWCAEASIYLRPTAFRRGIGKKLYALLEELLKLQGYRMVYAIITAANKASLAFHTAAGYCHTACFPRCGYKFGTWLDVIWMEKVLQIVEFPMNPPFPIGDIVKNDRKFCEILDKLSLS